ncbi:MAG: pyridoxine 5'-phosphate synthase [Bacteroidota bacterium]
MRLCINIDHIATLRNARGGAEPDPVAAAKVCEHAGADGIVVHLREDRRHIKDHDVWTLRETVKTKLDLEMGASDEIVSIALRVIPDLVTLVPEKRQELTTEGGLNVITYKEKLRRVIEKFHEKNIPVSLFIDPVKAQIEAAKEIESDMIEIHTGEYAEAKKTEELERLLKEITFAAQYGKQLGLEVNAGHGLNYTNVSPVAAIPQIDEMSIGHSIISRAAFVGLEKAVQEMLHLVK